MNVVEPVQRLGHSPESAAQALGVSRGTIYGLLQSGTLRSVKIGRRRIIPATALVELIEGPDAAA